MDAGGLLGPLLDIASSIDAIIYVAEPSPRRPLAFVSPAVERFFGYAPEEWLRDPDSLERVLHPADRACVRAEVEAWLAAGAREPLHLKYRLIAKDLRICWCRETLLKTDGAPAQLAGVIVDVTELKVLQHTVEAVAGAVEPQQAMLAFCDALAQALALDWVAWVSPGDVHLLASYGPLGERSSVSSLEWVPGEGIGLRAIEQRRLLVTHSQAQDDLLPAVRPLVGGAQFALAAPVMGGDRPRSALVGIARAARTPTPHQLRIAEALAHQAAVALERALLVSLLERTSRERQKLADELVRAHEAERSRLARELHDGAGQTLTAVAIQLDLAERAPAAPGEALRKARAQVEVTLEELRRLSHSLRPAALDRFGLGEALSEMCASLRSERLDVRLALPGEPLQLPAEHATALFRIAQAALTNVVRHASASTANVRVALGNGGVALEIDDDGRGFIPAYAPGALGLVAMRERAVALGGTFSVDAAPGLGTRVRAVLPLA